MIEVREILRRDDMEDLRKEFGTQYIINELLWFLLIELHLYAQVPPGGVKRGDGRGLLNLKWDLAIQSRLMECLWVIHNHQAEKQTDELLKYLGEN